MTEVIDSLFFWLMEDTFTKEEYDSWEEAFKQND